MADKLKCPFCGEEIKIAGERTTIMSCFNGECCGSGLYGEEAMWQALIQAKRDLAKAIDAIDTVRQHKRRTAVICPNDIAAYCDRIIAQITHDNKE